MTGLQISPEPNEPAAVDAADDASPCFVCRVGWVDNVTGECDEPNCPGTRAGDDA